MIVHCGATPVFCDVQPDTLNMDPESLERAITPRTKAIIAVHFAGHPCDMDEIGAVAAEHGVPVIEDAAHAVEAEYRGRPTGVAGRRGRLQLLRHQEHHHRRGRHAHDER